MICIISCKIQKILLPRKFESHLKIPKYHSLHSVFHRKIKTRSDYNVLKAQNRRNFVPLTEIPSESTKIIKSYFAPTTLLPQVKKKKKETHFLDLSFTVDPLITEKPPSRHNVGLGKTYDSLLEPQRANRWIGLGAKGRRNLPRLGAVAIHPPRRMVLIESNRL